ncbi:right-handed parallel beta-helix repeat-containing protein [Bradyrhizobium guangdongense]|uniref:Membrane protein n=1 Tax=Bradyrhizobium guangdongense TaxID=1325090 RepID=A0AA87W7G3_9BRAD|nr:right-handed parallel beta-helix repeat-containing protein [Bradyrhizobium guangdongense]GGI29216.1 membrane protein [Bradyrhizobium guangdongense]
MKVSLAVVALVLSFLFSTIPSYAQASRTWVSGVGDDANPCSRTAPCKTFAGAISKTAAGGEISVLDPGGFGAVTITKAISITNDGVGEAGVLVSGTNGIVVAAGASDVVNVRGVVIDGFGTGLSGIRITSAGSVNVQNCVIKNFSGGGTGTGISFAPNATSQLFVSDSIVSNNSGGIQVATASAGTHGIFAVLNRVQVENNATFGIKVDGTGGTGAISATARDSVSAGNLTNGIWATAPSGASAIRLLVDRSAAVNNAGVGILSDGPSTQVILNNSAVTGNITGLSFTNGGTMPSLKNSAVAGNRVTDGTSSAAVAPQ